MNGLTLATQFWEQVARPQIELDCPELLDHAAFGLVGEGSECFGFDDLISRDHDWGPGFCIWMDDQAWDLYRKTAAALYARLPREFYGFRRLHQIQQTMDRVGPQTIRGFYGKYLGIERPPLTLREWFLIPEHGLATATNGTVFLDRPGHFTQFRSKLLEYYPEDIRLKKLAAHCALAAQAGQYNYIRCQNRSDCVASLLAVSQFIDHIQAIVYLLNKRYRPYYKWSHRAMTELPLLGTVLADELEVLAASPMHQTDRIERISQITIKELTSQGLSSHPSDFLLHHGEYLQSRIQSPEIRQLHLMAE